MSNARGVPSRYRNPFAKEPKFKPKQEGEPDPARKRRSLKPLPGQMNLFNLNELDGPLGDGSEGQRNRPAE